MTSITISEILFAFSDIPHNAKVTIFTYSILVISPQTQYHWRPRSSKLCQVTFVEVFITTLCYNTSLALIKVLLGVSVIVVVIFHFFIFRKVVPTLNLPTLYTGIMLHKAWHAWPMIRTFWIKFCFVMEQWLTIKYTKDSMTLGILFFQIFQGHTHQ